VRLWLCLPFRYNYQVLILDAEGKYNNASSKRRASSGEVNLWLGLNVRLSYQNYLERHYVSRIWLPEACLNFHFRARLKVLNRRSWIKHRRDLPIEVIIRYLTWIEVYGWELERSYSVCCDNNRCGRILNCEFRQNSIVPRHLDWDRLCLLVSVGLNPGCCQCYILELTVFNWISRDITPSQYEFVCCLALTEHLNLFWTLPNVE